MNLKITCQIILLLALATLSRAQDPAAAAPTTGPVRLDSGFESLDANGKTLRPLEMAKKNSDVGVVFIFIGTDCPISNGYSPEITRVCEKFCRPVDASAGHGRGFDFYLVHADPDLAAKDALKHANEFGYTCPILMDPKKQLANRLGATVTPEVFVLTSDGTVQYSGRIDNLYSDFGKRRFEATTHELRDALSALADGKSVPATHTKAVGCPI